MANQLKFENKGESVLLSQPLISIGFPVYNGENYIQKSMDALLNQTYKNFEIIISDNASTDNTQAICLDYLERDSRIRYIRQPQNIGATENFIFVLTEAKGTYFLWNAYDDIRVETCLQYYLENIGTANAFYSSYGEYSYSLDRIIKSYDPPLLSGEEKNRSIEISEYFNKICPSMIYGIFKTDLIKKIGFEKVDWSDALLVIKYIELYGFKTTIAAPTIYLGFEDQVYKIKPLNGALLNPFPFLLKTFSILNFRGGYKGWFYYIKRMLSVMYITLKFNLFKK